MEILIAILSGSISALVALIGSHLVSKRSATAQMKVAVLTSFLSARLDAYRDFEAAISTWSEHRDQPSCEGVYRAANIVTLVASEETITCLAKVQAAVRSFETSGVLPDAASFGLDKLQLQISMHNDLLSFQSPEISFHPTRAKKAMHKQ